VPTALEGRLGYQFHDPALLSQALTHPSSGCQPDNQRLEFLGDALFGAALALLLFREKPDWPEGAMTKLSHLLVSTDALFDWAQALELRLQLPPKADPSHLKTSFRKPLADAVEALLAAVFLDAQKVGEDGFAAVYRLIEQRFLDPIHQAEAGSWERHDTKTTLQERAASQGLSAPNYEMLGRSGPDHAPTFSVRVTVGPHHAQATARSLKQAQVEAARKVLESLSAPSKCSGAVQK
jgi:ribonuclease-3